MMRFLLLFLLSLVSVTATAQPSQPFVVGEWAGDCKGDYRIGYRTGPGGKLIAYTVNKGIRADFGSPTVRAESSEFFTLDFNDGGAPIVWKIDGQTIRPWRQGPDDSIIKNGMRDGVATPVFERCG